MLVEIASEREPLWPAGSWVAASCAERRRVRGVQFSVSQQLGDAGDEFAFDAALDQVAD